MYYLFYRIIDTLLFLEDTPVDHILNYEFEYHP
jgi:hypothetical protein